MIRQTAPLRRLRVDQNLCEGKLAGFFQPRCLGLSIERARRLPNNGLQQTRISLRSTRAAEA